MARLCFQVDDTLGIQLTGDAQLGLTHLDLLESPNIEEISHPDPLLNLARERLMNYFAGMPESFDNLILSPQGTPFQQRVWKGLRQIPYGLTVSYQQLAEQVGNPKAYRAVGSANGKNPIPIIIPCHRVIQQGGGLGGYSVGSGTAFKQRLLKLEGAMIAPRNASPFLAEVC